MKKFLLLAIVATSLSSCLSQKAIKRGEIVKEQIQELRNLNKEKVAAGTQSPEIGEEIDKTYEKMQSNVSELQDEVKKDPKSLGKQMKLTSKAKSYQTTIETFLKVYKLQTFKSFQSSRFFRTGEYKIAAEDAQYILEDMNPLIDNILEIIRKDRSVNIEVIMGVYGYTDEQEIASNGDLYNKLSAQIKSRNPSQAQLNQKLSEFRAKSLADILLAAVGKRDNREAEKNHIFFNINWLGRGYSALPFKNMESKKIDENRRVVTVLWGLKPLLAE